jgi:hypothetical protein
LVSLSDDCVDVGVSERWVEWVTSGFAGE